MHKKITLIMLFLFSFVIAHDTVIAVVEKKHSPSTVKQAIVPQVLHTAKGCKVLDIAQLHMMFHFVALAPHAFSIFSSSSTKAAPATHRLQYADGIHQTSHKPPIVL